MADNGREGRGLGNWLVDRLLRAVIWLLLALPHRVRVPLMGWLARHIIGPLTGYGRRARANLAYIWPDMPEAERRRIAGDGRLVDRKLERGDILAAAECR